MFYYNIELMSKTTKLSEIELNEVKIEGDRVAYNNTPLIIETSYLKAYYNPNYNSVLKVNHDKQLCELFEHIDKLINRKVKKQHFTLIKDYEKDGKVFKSCKIKLSNYSHFFDENGKESKISISDIFIKHETRMIISFSKIWERNNGYGITAFLNQAQYGAEIEKENMKMFLFGK
jgi:hypothetical protein